MAIDCCFSGCCKRQGHQPIAQAAGRIQPLAVVAARQAGGYLGRLVLGKLDDLPVREMSVGKVELVNHVVFTAADQQSFSVGGEAEAVERLGQGDARHDAGRLEIDDGDLMRSIAGMQDRGPIALRVQGHIDGKIAQFDLLAHRSQRPLVGQQHGAVGLQSGQGGSSSRGSVGGSLAKTPIAAGRTSRADITSPKKNRRCINTVSWSLGELRSVSQPL